jgi:phosphomannomutase
MAEAAASYTPLAERPIPNTIALFDVDLTLTIPRRVSTLHPSSSKSYF